MEVNSDLGGLGIAMNFHWVQLNSSKVSSYPQIVTFLHMYFYSHSVLNNLMGRQKYVP